mmetsp:Transcript_10486/g.14287  ORF Transcript_10486/g.14287 Transcript_10486/m.14287 type:complete len:222 (+) Transcript_10486:280-945(+)
MPASLRGSVVTPCPAPSLLLGWQAGLARGVIPTLAHVVPLVVVGVWPHAAVARARSHVHIHPGVTSSRDACAASHISSLHILCVSHHVDCHTNLNRGWNALRHDEALEVHRGEFDGDFGDGASSVPTLLLSLRRGRHHEVGLHALHGLGGRKQHLHVVALLRRHLPPVNQPQGRNLLHQDGPVSLLTGDWAGSQRELHQLSMRHKFVKLRHLYYAVHTQVQ